jgi:hypothetical protein
MAELAGTNGGSGNARAILGFASWALVAWIVVGYLSIIPQFDAWLSAMEASAWMRVIVASCLIAAGVTALTAWTAAVWHAASDQQRHGIPRFVLIGTLLFGNVAAAFFYYFLFVRWQSRPRDREPADSHR